MKKRILKLLVSVFIILVLSGCEKTASKESSSVNEKETTTLRLEGSNIGIPNPFRHTSRGPGMARMWLLYDSLLEKDETGEVPWLAKSWDISDDGAVITFHLRENVSWHDGQPLTADDVAFTFSYYKDHPPVYNTLVSENEYLIAETNVVDDYTIEVELSHFELGSLMDMGYSRILPRHIWQNIDDPNSYNGEDALIGSGPYRMDSFSAEQGAYRYVSFESYWGQKPVFEAIEWIPVSDNVLAFENGEIDLMRSSADMLGRYKNDSRYVVKSVPSLHSYRLMLNMETVPALLDVNVREAIAYAIDRQEIIDSVMRGAAVPSSAGYVPIENIWYNSDLQQYEYNPEKAKELLEGQIFSFTLLTDNSAESTKTAEMIKIDLEAAGMEVRVESVESRTRDNALATGEYELLLINSGGLGGDPDFLRTLYGRDAGIIKGWSNEVLFDLLSLQAVERDSGTRKEMINKAQELIAREVPLIMLFGAVDNYVYPQNSPNEWTCVYDSNKIEHNKLSYLHRDK